MCRITVVVYFFTLLLSCHVQNSSQLSAGQILQCQDCMRAVKQIYSIRYIDISIVLSLCLPSLAELHPMAFQWNRSLPSIRQKMLEACVFRGGVRGVLCCRKFFALLLSGILGGSCVNVDKNFFIQKQTKILGWVLPCVISRRASICRIKWCKMLAVVVSFSQPLTLNFSWNFLLRNSWKSLSSSSLSPKISSKSSSDLLPERLTESSELEDTTTKTARTNYATKRYLWNSDFDGQCFGTFVWNHMVEIRLIQSSMGLLYWKINVIPL